jgi:hypothetical protein
VNRLAGEVLDPNHLPLSPTRDGSPRAAAFPSW